MARVCHGEAPSSADACCLGCLQVARIEALQERAEALERAGTPPADAGARAAAELRAEGAAAGGAGGVAGAGALPRAAKPPPPPLPTPTPATTTTATAPPTDSGSDAASGRPPLSLLRLLSGGGGGGGAPASGAWLTSFFPSAQGSSQPSSSSACEMGGGFLSYPPAAAALPAGGEGGGWAGRALGEEGGAALSAARRALHARSLACCGAAPAAALGGDCFCTARGDDGKGWYRGRAGTAAYYTPQMLLRLPNGERLPCTSASGPLAHRGGGVSAYPFPAATTDTNFPTLLLYPRHHRNQLPFADSCEGDWFSYGCTVFALLTGRSPFSSGAGSEQDNELTRRGRVAWARHAFSPAATDFLARLLTVDPRKRLGAGAEGWRAVMGHPFFSGVQWGLLEARVQKQDDLPP